jgi:hypothetical protein
MQGDEADPGALCWFRSPIQWSRFEAVEDQAAVRVFYFQAGGSQGPAWNVSEVHVSESPREVEITLFERVLGGTFLDGAAAATTLAAVPGCMEIALSEPVADRRLVDGSTGKRALPLDRAAGPGKDDWAAASASLQECPRWIS